MAVSTENAISGPYTANGVTTAFPFTFKAISADDVSVLVRDADGGSVVATGYSVSLNASGGGTVTFDTAPASGHVITPYLDPSFTQEIEFENGSAWVAEPVNEGYDRSAIRDQVLRRDQQRTFRVPLGEEAGDLPSVADRAGKFFAFDAEGLFAASSGTGGADSALRTDLATGTGSLLQLKGTAPGVIGETLRNWYDGFIQPERFGATGDGAANDTAAWTSLMEFVTEQCEASSTDPDDINVAKLARRIDGRGRQYRIDDRVLIPQRQVDRTGNRLIIEKAQILIDGDFVLYDTDVTDPTLPVAEFLSFRDVLFKNADPANTASCFDPRFLRVEFDHCEWWQQRCLNSDRYAQEWNFLNCLARWVPVGQNFFDSQGCYAVRSYKGKYQFNGGKVFDVAHDTGAKGCVGFGFMGDTAESNYDNFLRAGQILGLHIGGGFYSEGNGAPLLDLRCVSGGENRGVFVSVYSQPNPTNIADANFYDIIWGPGGGTAISCAGIGNLHDNSLCIGQLEIIDNKLYTPETHRVSKYETIAQDGLVPDPLSAYATKVYAEVATIDPVNGVAAHTVALPKPRKGMHITLINLRSALTYQYAVLPDHEAGNGSTIRGNSADVPLTVNEGERVLFFCVDEGELDGDGFLVNGVWDYAVLRGQMALIAEPTGGTTVDAEARAWITSITAALKLTGRMAKS